MAYVQNRHHLSDEQSRRFCLNPDLSFATRMETFNTSVWASSEMMAAVKAQEFDSPSLKAVNEFIDGFAKAYPQNESKIMDYLRGLGHPLGGAGGGGSGCMLVFACLAIPTALILWLI